MICLNACVILVSCLNIAGSLSSYGPYSPNYAVWWFRGWADECYGIYGHVYVLDSVCI